MSFEHLPTELYDAILCYVPSPDLQHTVLAVTRAIPLSPVPLYHLFRSIRITHPDQAVYLHRRLRQRKPPVGAQNGGSTSELELIAGWVKELSVESWTVDAEVVINVVRLLPKLHSLNIWVGPHNFAPEHLEEVFARPLLNLSYLALRFRPYVQKATHYHFLKGSYFDSTLFAIARWPTSSLPTLSIVQDPFNPDPELKLSFAQPIVFFGLDACASVLLHSPALSPSLTSLRLRIPSRPVARSVCTAMTSGPFSNPSYNSVTPPELEFLDLSTCGVLESEVDTILVRFPTIKHIILDGCAVLRGELREGEWNALGRRCALVGVRRAKEREKALKAWFEARDLSAVNVDMGNAANAARKGKRGRKGLATATISFRAPEPPTATTSTTQPFPRPISHAFTQHEVKRASKIRILPSLPSLTTLSITVSPLVKPEKYPMIRAEFEAGWAEGVALLAITKARLRNSARNGYRIMRSSTRDADEAEEEEGLEGLEDVRASDDAAFESPTTDSADSMAMSPPILCFAGPSRDGNHEGDCGHKVAWETMGDDM